MRFPHGANAPPPLAGEDGWGSLRRRDASGAVGRNRRRRFRHMQRGRSRKTSGRSAESAARVPPYGVFPSNPAADGSCSQVTPSAQGTFTARPSRESAARSAASERQGGGGG